MRVKKRSFEVKSFMLFFYFLYLNGYRGDCGDVTAVLTSSPSPLRRGRNLHRNLEIPLVARTELGSDLDLTPILSDRCGNVLRTTHNDCR